MVTDLEALGYLSRVADPNDARAKILRYTENRRRFMRDRQIVRQALHAGCGAIVGLAAFAAPLEHFADSLEEDGGVSQVCGVSMLPDATSKVCAITPRSSSHAVGPCISVHWS